MNRLIYLIPLLLFPFILPSCSEDGAEVGKGQAAVQFCVGDGAVPSRGAFTKEKPLLIYVFQRSNAGVQDFTAAPYKTVTGKTGTTANSNGLSDIILTDGTLYLENGYTYDFVLLVNPPEDASLAAGGLSGIPHGVDLMAGRADAVAVAADATEVIVSFTEGGANEGNLPHLCSRIDIQATATTELISSLGEVRLGITSATFSPLYPQASLAFADATMKLTGSGSRTSSYEMKCNTIPKTVATAGDFAAGTGDIALFANGILLPLPLLPNTTKNTLDIDFYVNVNGADVLMAAEAVQVAEFKPGYKYTFTLTMKGNTGGGAIDLYLTVEPWQTVEWNNAMGGDSADDKVVVLIGTWSKVTWNNVMGGEDDSDRMTLSVDGFTDVDWSLNMGGTNDNGTND